MGGPVQFAVEGMIDEAVVYKLFKVSGIIPRKSHVCRGIENLRRRLGGFNANAHYAPWFVLCDLDREKCPATRRSDFFKRQQTKGLLFCVAVRSIEAWLMADRKSLAKFLGVDGGIVPREPEQLPDPKGAFLDLTRKSPDRNIREGLASYYRGKLRQGNDYNNKVGRYVENHWSPKRACATAPSLERAFKRCQTFVEKGSWS